MPDQVQQLTTGGFTSAAVTRELDDDATSTGSDMQQKLEVDFGDNHAHRRKSSLSGPAVSAEQHSSRLHTSCLVHAHLDKNRAVEGDMRIGKDSKNDKGALATRADDGLPQSRLLTKKQLSEMAMGIRELSKKLSHIRMKLHVRSIFILTKVHDEELVLDTQEIVLWLLQQNKETAPFTIYVDERFADKSTFDYSGIIEQDPSYGGRLKFWTDELCAKRPHAFDIVISLGGDGTVLYSSWLFQRIVPPVLSFSLGSLGFLTKFDYGDYANILGRAFTEGIAVSLRLRFEVTVMRSQHRTAVKVRDLVEELVGDETDDEHTHRPDTSRNILNDIVVDRGPNPTMSQLEIFGDDEHFTTMQADGVCISTPTGSTAYNLAAGGSLSHPDNPVMCLTAICAHTLSFRPLILPDTMVLRIGVPYDARTSSWASFDGRKRVELQPGDYVTVSASRYPFPTVLPLDRQTEDWVANISRTLNWNSRARQKPFNHSES